jgi:hypothetical protein
MLKSRSRIISVTLAVGALTMLVPGAALAEVSRATPLTGGDAPGTTDAGRVPLCETAIVLTGTPLCPPLSPR